MCLVNFKSRLEVKLYSLKIINFYTNIFLLYNFIYYISNIELTYI